MVEEWGGNGVVLQDKLPKLVPSTPPRRPGFMEEKNGPSVMCVTTYSDDEPIDELIEALRSIEGVTSYLTGNYSKTRYANELASFKEDGVVLTGYISEIDYVDLMASVDVVVVLTIHEDLLTCGAYEAISLEKPLVLSDTHALRSYFRGAATYVKPTASSIGEGITELLEKKKIESDGSIDWKREINDTWLIFFHKACFRLEETRCK
ncbi:glycosyltransferase [Natronocella acetinitrilica]|uniref:glycosyltransferase n=1 Tax=Natronocella acetinitrilica TaxID=414046 RepID=UPI0020A02C5F